MIVRSILLLALAVLLTAGTIDLLNLFDYEDPDGIPSYVIHDNTPGNNPITDAGATLGRVLFYDQQLSLNGSVSCGSCHRQEFAFGDTARVSLGLDGGETGRHSMRLAYISFGEEQRMFWDERAAHIEDQVLQPIQDHLEMGWSGENGQPGLDSLTARLAQLDYYQDLFTFVYGDPAVTPVRMRRALAQFLRSIRSFDSKYDEGVALNNGQFAPPFPNFTDEENLGKALFRLPPGEPGTPPSGLNGAGCLPCHGPPEFGIDAASLNNGVIGVAGDPDATDLTNTRAPSLRDVAHPDGLENGPFMHDGSLNSLLDVIDHYNDIPFHPAVNPMLDPKLRGGATGTGQDLALTKPQKDALIAFLKTLTSTDIYTNPKWSDPFDANGNIDVVGIVGTDDFAQVDLGVEVFPNPVVDVLQIRLTEPGTYSLRLIDGLGASEIFPSVSQSTSIDLSGRAAGRYWLEFSMRSGERQVISIIKL